MRVPMQVGGQAVMEGVMMRGPGTVATAVRRADGTVAIHKQSFVSLSERYRLLKLPLLRGAVGLIEMLVIGIRALNYSAEVSLHDTGNPDHHHGNGRDGKKPPRTPARESFALGATLALSLAIGIAVFFVVPLVVTTSLFRIEQDPLSFNLVAGACRIVLLFT